MSRRNRKLIVGLLSSLLLLALYIFQPSTHVQPAPAVPGMYRVIDYADGDTITVSMNGTEERIRFIGVDTPETKKPNKPAQCFADEAAAFTRQAVDGKSVRLEADSVGDNRDRYDRLLRYVYSEDGTLLNKSLIEQGYAFAYTQFSFSKKAEFVQAQRSASSAKTGLWGACTVTNNNGRFRTNPLE